ncbi:hypothetical protein KAH27_09320 [bacterium]|nr:hypothetical protein [bacterium]
MPLITCRDCKKEISTKAVSCPNCGRPNANAGIVTIEQSQKKWKLWNAIGLLLAIPGGLVTSWCSFVIPMNPNPKYVPLMFIAISMGIIGILIVIVAGIGRWYHHG